MRALVCKSLTEDFSGVGIEDIPVPEIGAEDVLVRVKSASLNYPDLLLCQGKYQLKLDPPFVPGMDISGVVEAAGEDVTAFQPGDAVCGGVRFGGFADYAAVPASALRAKPETFSHDQAAAYPAAFMTAYVALVERCRLQAGETLLVHGASGGVGTAAVLVGKKLGAKVIATGGSDDKLAKVKSLGADHVLNTQDGFKSDVKALTKGRGADVIFDPVGGDVFDESVRCIAFDGRLAVIGFTSGRIATLPTNMALIKGFSLVGVRAGEYGRQFPERGDRSQAAIWAWAEQGDVTPPIHSSLPLEAALDGFEMLQSRQVVGKLVIRL